MKTFRLIGMALVAMMMCVNFSGCSKDDDGTPEDPTIVTSKGKRLKKIEGDIDVYDGNDYMIFNYDEKGRLKSSTSFISEGSGSYWDQEFIWSNDKIVSYGTWETWAGGTMYTHSLEDGKIVLTCDPEEAIEHSGDIFTYKDDKLDTYGSIYKNHVDLTCEFTVKWDGDKIASSINYAINDHNYTSFVYSGKTKGFNPLWIKILFGHEWDDEEYTLFFAHPELCGLDKVKDLVTEKIDTKSGAVLNRYTYELDKDGYITKIIDYNVYDNDCYALNLTWE